MYFLDSVFQFIWFNIDAEMSQFGKSVRHIHFHRLSFDRLKVSVRHFINLTFNGGSRLCVSDRLTGILNRFFNLFANQDEFTLTLWVR